MTYFLRPGLPRLPGRMHNLPIDDRGYPIPEFVSNLDGTRDFRVVSLEHLAKCIRDSACWICGQPLETWKVFVIGPLAAIQGTSNEPPSHVECAEFAVRACPFLLLPKAQYRPTDIPNIQKMPGSMKRNPGACCLYTVTGYSHHKKPDGRGIIFRYGSAVRVDWYTQGRPAKRSEVLASINASLLAVHREASDQAIEKRVAELLPAYASADHERRR
jgi:ferredoxin